MEKGRKPSCQRFRTDKTVSATSIRKTTKFRFCFYTSSGTENETSIGPRDDDGGVFGLGDNVRGGVKGLAATTLALSVPEDVLQRSHSASSIDDILYQAQRVMSPIEYSESPLKSRSSSCDDLVSLSGSLTPTLTPTRTPPRL